MPIILNKQARTITFPYENSNGHLKYVRLFGYTLDLTEEQYNGIKSNPLFVEYINTGEFVIVNEQDITSFQIINHAPVANGSQGTFPVSHVADPKINDVLYKKIDKLQEGDSEVDASKVIAPKAAKNSPKLSK
jgi:hypothetical protein